MARCAIRAAFSSGAILRLARIPAPSFRRLTLRSATGKSQRDFPAKIKISVGMRTTPHSRETPLALAAGAWNDNLCSVSSLQAVPRGKTLNHGHRANAIFENSILL